MDSIASNPAWLLSLLQEGEVYKVGGPVRDRLLGEKTGKDTDYLVRLISIERLQQLLRPHGHVNLVGKSFGVIKFTPKAGEGEEVVTFDIALPRTEQSTGAAHTDFLVDFDPQVPVERDLLRRDFTINAMAENCATGELIDPAGGQADLRAKCLRMVFEGAFRDDPLRILRGAQFLARFELTLDPVTRAAMQDAVPLVATVSMERVAEELTKLITLSKKPSLGFKLLQELGALKIILPELEDTVGVDQPGGYHAFPVFEHSLYTADAAPAQLRLRWAALLHDINKPQCKQVDGTKATFYAHEKLGSRTARKVLRRLTGTCSRRA
ncbi:MAG: HDIG domain-containing protein [candidate division Zixibacteria bacterium]|nr:HDIG domain-containing protein [candidate division Zixibacteria bacterium]